jgi:phosphopantothenoylcysteine synthetase/decarboxylase
MHFLITAGPTREPLDPVRYLTNRSSGKMGYALAVAAQAAGHEVTLISGPVMLPAPAGVHLVSVETAREMFEAVQAHLSSAQVAIFAAAVADYRPAFAATQKIKKKSETLTLELERTEDILGSARSLFGFRGYLAQDKLARKGCDLVIANDVSVPGIGFDSSENAVTLCLPGGETQVMPQQSKTSLASTLIRFIALRLTHQRSAEAWQS